MRVNCSVGLTPPIKTLATFDPKFKVEVCCLDPLWARPLDANDIHLDVSVLCSQIDLLCHQELVQSSGRIEHGNTSGSFEGKVLILLDRLKKAVQKLCSPGMTCEDYLEYSGLSKLYPRAAAYVTRPQDLSLALKKTHMDGYYNQVSSLHQVISLCQQIAHDVIHLNNHKYIAHQLALLYQSLNNHADCLGLAELRKNIQENFGTIKDALTSTNEECPKLSYENAHWISQISEKIIQQVLECPRDITKAFYQPASILSSVKKQ